jgi:hypothetical protein
MKKIILASICITINISAFSQKQLDGTFSPKEIKPFVFDTSLFNSKKYFELSVLNKPKEKSITNTNINNVIILPLDNMPCYVPLKNATTQIKTLILKSEEVEQIPNPLNKK